MPLISPVRVIAACLALACLAAAPDPAGKPQVRLALGEAAPPIAASTLEGQPISIAGLHGSDSAHPKLIVLQFGSITEPIFRSHLPAVEKLAGRYADKANFVILYQQEAHAADSESAIDINTDQGFAIAAPANIAERQALAKQMTDRLSIKNETVVVDVWNNTTALRYGSYPNMTFIIDEKGNLQAGYPWMDTAKVTLAIETLALGKPLPPELKGSVKPSAAAALDFTGAAMDMTGGRGPAAVAMAIDKLDLTDAQLQAIYPALAAFMADLTNFRQTRPAGAARGAAPQNAATGAATQRVITPGDSQAALQSLRASATKLTTVIKKNSNPKQAAELFDALEQMQAQRLFANP